MEHWFTLYLLTRLDAIVWAALILMVLFPAASAFVLVVGYDSDKLDRAKPLARKLLVAAACSLFVAVFTPSQKDALFIAGGAAVIEAAKSETAQRVAGKSVEAVERWLDSVMQEEKNRSGE
ncbi:MAG TPA: hypothetical protein PKE37_16390 [Thiomonas arsenitoxydans]|uniref:hypothetical protein n=1 Tax=Thiomonas arsenitoxydans (strain DSM 22701 / CIP 110005 / 3As) TaxID=426114 RepID=UPI002C33331B|nr:hypothetical protein [Thiomonas arsenitoxydans]HML83334.1 hypothetical protein [Thiomonas arsenitoxydans]